MGHLLLGHGGLIPADVAATANGFETVAVPPGTTLQFYADMGQKLMLSTSLLDMWSQLEQPWPPLDSTNVTYNLTLSEFPDLGELELHAIANGDEWAKGHEIHIPGFGDLPKRVTLCTGHPDCPTDPTERRPHVCDGILARYTGELYWLACTWFPALTPELSTVMEGARDGAPSSVLLGQDPDDPTASARAFLGDVDTSDKLSGAKKWFYTELSNEERANLLADPQIAAWSEQYPDDDPAGSEQAHLLSVAKRYVKYSSPAELITWYHQTLTDHEREIVLANPQIAALVQQYPLDTGDEPERPLADIVRDFMQHPDSFLEWYRGLDQEMLDQLNDDPVLALEIEVFLTEHPA